MNEMPENGKFEYGPRDPVTGERWVYVSREMAHAHPKGKLGPVLYMIVLYLVAVAGVRVYEFVQFGFEPLFLFLSILPMLAAVGLYFRIPFALVLVVLILGFGVIGLVTRIETLTIFGLGQLAVWMAILFYLLTDARANLIYRHRYRSLKGPD